jgi:hypothetical protein
MVPATPENWWHRPMAKEELVRFGIMWHNIRSFLTGDYGSEQPHLAPLL